MDLLFAVMQRTEGRMVSLLFSSSVEKFAFCSKNTKKRVYSSPTINVLCDNSR